MTSEIQRTPDMLDNATIANLNALKLLGFAEGLQEQRGLRPQQQWSFRTRAALKVLLWLHLAACHMSLGSVQR